MENKIIFKAIVGSQAQGTATPLSDNDFKGIYIQPIDDLISYGYQEFDKVSKDEIYYEVRRFFDLLINGNPEALELLYSPDDCILVTSPQFELIRANKEKFLTKKCAKSFGNYGYSQIKKAKGLNKMINWEAEKVERKTPIDFCYVCSHGKTIPVEVYLKSKKMDQDNCGLIKLNHADEAYAMYYDTDRMEKLKGIIGEDSNEVRLSPVSKEFTKNNDPLILFYNKDGYSTHCRNYKSYQTWLSERNINRYHQNKSNASPYDSKNLSHCRRLIDIAREIAETGTFSVRRPNAKYLLAIKHGELPLEEILEKSQKDISDLQELYKKSNLPEEVDQEFVKNLLLQIRKM
jgi:hypothetical protein